MEAKVEAEVEVEVEAEVEARGGGMRMQEGAGEGSRTTEGPAAQFLVPAIPPLKNVVIEEFVDEVDMGEDHSPAAIPLELQHVHRISVNRRWG